VVVDAVRARLVVEGEGHRGCSCRAVALRALISRTGGGTVWNVWPRWLTKRAVSGVNGWWRLQALCVCNQTCGDVGGGVTRQRVKVVNDGDDDNGDDEYNGGG
jgi:hypothetical protein